MFGVWDVRDVECSRCGMFRMWDVWDVACSGCGMFRMWDVQGVGCSGCGMFGIWDVRYGMFAGMWDVNLQNALISKLISLSAIAFDMNTAMVSFKCSNFEHSVEFDMNTAMVSLTFEFL